MSDKPPENTLGDLIATIYPTMQATFPDPEEAAEATAQAINRWYESVGLPQRLVLDPPPTEG